MQLWGSLADIGEHGFYLQSIVGKGFVSGEEIVLIEHAFLSQALVIDTFPEFDQSNKAISLADGWNNIFSVSMTAAGDQPVEIYKLSWSLENFAINLEELELWINDQLYPTELVIKDNILITSSVGYN